MEPSNELGAWRQQYWRCAKQTVTRLDNSDEATFEDVIEVIQNVYVANDITAAAALALAAHWNNSVTVYRGPPSECLRRRRAALVRPSPDSKPFRYIIN